MNRGRLANYVSSRLQEILYGPEATFMVAKEAVRAAKERIIDLFQDEGVLDVGLQELEYLRWSSWRVGGNHRIPSHLEGA